ncbi:MAG: tol-pal system-associated acyl-CoA thioesterase [Gammaproteobacteria bacterium]|nr:tol-pal system-associated acyl-CoA thioesterase [Gammaproteobacteria bacterium]MBU1645078.1 tol-pal system-associated acyl-CoA thioesterase [Gammaproteobacteria bacterium]MBU1973315.1 tol-pal system-associated acyl-CoA thioesterase [Gammaproteobacteria bacterium]
MSYTQLFRVYYEDTDSGGVVYYANYLKFLERGRTELLRGLGFEQAELARDAGVAFAVRSLQVEYLGPARLDDKVEVRSSIGELGRAQVVFSQRIEREGELLVDATVRVACLDLARGKAAAIPKNIYEKLKELT